MTWFKLLTSLFIYLLIVQCGHINTLNRVSPSLEREISSESFIDIVFDLDWTLVSENINTSQKLFIDNRVTVKGIEYRINDWALEMITELSTRQNVRISFYSGGKIERNKELLSKLKLMDNTNRSFLDIAYKVKSFSDLYKVPESQILGDMFADKFKKNLLEINEDLSNLIIIDDNYKFAIDEIQKKNMFWLGPSYIHYESYKHTPTELIDDSIKKFVPKSASEWFVGRNKLLFIWGILDKALDNSKNKNFVDLVNQYSQNLNLATGEYNSTLKSVYREYFFKLKKVGIRRGRATLGNSCITMLRSFL